MKCRMMAIMVALVMGFGVLSPVSSQADPVGAPPEVLSIVHLGDSYSAGNGAGSYHGVPECQQSQANWGRRFADWVSSLGVHVAYTNRACSGARIEHLFGVRGFTDQDQPERLVVGRSEAEVREMLERYGSCDVSAFDEIISADIHLRPLGPDLQGEYMFAFRCKTVLAPQAEAVTAGTDLVLMSMGGNDIAFEQVVTNCFAPRINFIISAGASAENCEQSIVEARGLLRRVMTNLRVNLERLIETRMAGNQTSQVVLMNYPKLATETSFLLKFQEPDADGKDRYYDASREVRALSDLALRYQRRIVREINAKHPGRVMLIDSTPDAFEGHEPNPVFGTANPQRWLNEFVETEGDYVPGGQIEARLSVDVTNFWHPNIAGHRELGRLVVASGINTSAPLLSGWGQEMDVVLIVDATSSMAGRWAYIRQAVERVLGQLTETDARVALVTYQDHPEGGGAPGNYPARVDQDFTADPEAIIRAFSQIELAAAGDARESVYSGIEAGLNLTWRSGVKKIMLVLGDGPAKEPEPVSGLTAQSIARKAFEVDPAEVFVVGTGGAAASGDDLSQLAEETGGELLIADTPPEVPEAATQAMTNAAARPFGWLQGPYVAKVGSTVRLDARGSFSPAGPIVKYEWDFEGDGVWDRTTDTGETDFTYSSELEGFVGVRVTDTTGATGLGSTRIWITRDGDIIDDQVDNCPDVANPTQQDLNQNWIGDECEDPDQFQVLPPPGVVDPSPTPSPSATPSGSPMPSGTPSLVPSVAPTGGPTVTPTGADPTASPSASVTPSLPTPSGTPTVPAPTGIPSPISPTATPSASPSGPTTPEPSVPTRTRNPVPSKPGLPHTGV